MCLHEERVLHIAGRMVVGEVHGTIDVPVILDFGSFCEGKSQTRENINNLILDNCQGMTGTKLNRISRTCQIHIVRERLLSHSRRLELIDTFGCQILELIDTHTNLFLHFCGNRTEVVHQGADLTLLAEIFDAQSLCFLRCSCLQSVDFIH